ncbi:putative inorganic carbon transporter subunit DabA, partial [Metallibacterium sp.]
MSPALGHRLRIRAMVHVAGEPIPFFWPMRAFIHHNPLYGLEHLPFPEAVQEGEQLFHARGYLPRALYQRYLAQGAVDAGTLAGQVDRFLAGESAFAGIDWHRLLMTLLTTTTTPVTAHATLADASDIHAAMTGAPLPAHAVDIAALAARVKSALPPECPVYIGVDELFGTSIGATLDELVIKSCLEFFDEGQSVWQMPGREHGLFAAWSALARRNLRLFIRGLHIQHILAQDDTPEGIINYAMNELRVPEDAWVEYFTRSLTRLHGWAGYIRWRSAAKNYHWNQRYPADLVDYLAIRLVLGLALLREHATRLKVPGDAQALARFIDEHPAEAYLRREFHGGHVLPALAHATEDAVASGRQARIERLLPDYLAQKRADEAQRQAEALRDLAARAGLDAALSRLTPDELNRLLS